MGLIVQSSVVAALDLAAAVTSVAAEVDNPRIEVAQAAAAAVKALEATETTDSRPVSDGGNKTSCSYSSVGSGGIETNISPINNVNSLWRQQHHQWKQQNQQQHCQ